MGEKYVKDCEGFEDEKTEQERMLLSAETRLGLRMTGMYIFHYSDKDDVCTHVCVANSFTE